MQNLKNNNSILTGSSQVFGNEVCKSAILSGSSNQITGNCPINNSSIISGENNLINRYYGSVTNNNVIVGGKENHICNSNNSGIIAGRYSCITNSYSSVIANGSGYTGYIPPAPMYGVQYGCNKIEGGCNNFLTGGTRDICGAYKYNFPNGIYNSCASSIIGGRFNCISETESSVIIGGFGNINQNSYQSVIQGGRFNCMYDSSRSAIITSNTSKIHRGSGAVISGGTCHCVNGAPASFNDSVIIGGFRNTIGDCVNFSNFNASINSCQTCIYNCFNTTLGVCNGLIGQGNVKWSVLLGGECNRIISTSSIASNNNIVSGCCNTLSCSNNAAIIGGQGLSFSSICNQVIMPSLIVASASTQRPHMRLVAGASVSTPSAGDFWFDGTRLYIRVGSTTCRIAFG